MSNLLPIKLKNGQEVLVSEYKRDNVIGYLDVFPELKNINRVYLFGSTLEQRCTERSDVDLCFVFNGPRKVFHESLLQLWETYPLSASDDILGFNVNDFDNGLCWGVLQSIKEDGVKIYDSTW